VIRPLLPALLLAGLAIAGCSAPPEPSAPTATLTMDPLMSRGPANAKVTIVEFSDYQ
jgi:protein-disulfide isomerase